MIEAALSDTSRRIEFTASEGDTVGHQTGTIDPREESITINAISGDEFLANESVPAPTVVKIDVEGAEPRVIQGLEETLASDPCRALYCEIHLPAEHRPSIRDWGVALDDVLETIVDLGFDIEYERDGGTEGHVKATK